MMPVEDNDNQPEFVEDPDAVDDDFEPNDVDEENFSEDEGDD